MSLGIYFKVVTDGRGETHVATTQTEDAIRQFQLLQEAFNVVEHLLMALARVLGSIDAHDFYFGEFVESVQTSYILAV